MYVKIGGGPEDMFVPQSLTDGCDLAALQAYMEKWAESGGDAAAADQLHALLLHVLPSLQPDGISSKACFTTVTDDGHMHIQKSGSCDGALVVAVGCQGKSAGAALAIGEDVASALLCQLPHMRQPKASM